MKAIILTEKEREALHSLLSQRAEAAEYFFTRDGKKFTVEDLENLIKKLNP